MQTFDEERVALGTEHVIVVLQAPDLQPAAVSRALAVEPTESNVPRPVVVDLDGTTVELDDPGRWILDTRSTMRLSASIEEHCSFVLSILQRGRDDVLPLLRLHEILIDITVVILQGGSFQPGRAFEKELKDLGIPVEVGIVETGDFSG